MIGAPYPGNGASISRCGQYRYLLWRTWDNTLPRLAYVMLNPSKADACTDDATIRVCMGRARRMNYGGIDVLNLFALRATNPAELARHPMPLCEPEQLEAYTLAVAGAAAMNPRVICAWGNHGRYRDQGAHMMAALRRKGVRPYALKLTKAGYPCHPLRIGYDVQPFEISGTSSDGV